MKTNELLPRLLQTLSPETLARMIIDLEQAQEDWAHYPEDAPSPADQTALIELIPQLHQTGQQQAKAEGRSFDHIFEQVKEQLDASDWASERDDQEVQNWLNDFD